MNDVKLNRYWREIEKKLKKETNIKQENLMTIEMFIDLVVAEELKKSQNTDMQETIFQIYRDIQSLKR